MAGTQIQFRRGTTAQHSTFTGAVGEITVDTDKKVAVVHDGSTAGGAPLLRQDYSNAGSALSFRNKIINGDFRINQRVYVSGATVGTNLYGHDRWKMAASGDTYTFSTTSNKVTVTIPAGKVLRQVVEGLNLKTGTYCLSWEGTAQGKIGAGSLGASGVTGSITGGTDTTIEFGPGTVSNVQLEEGSVATPFESRPYGTELALCQRYYYRTPSGVAERLSVGYAQSTTLADGIVYFPATMRTAPTSLEQSGTASDYNVAYQATSANCSSVPTFVTANTLAATTRFTVASGLTAGDGVFGRSNSANGYLGWSAEL